MNARPCSTDFPGVRRRHVLRLVCAAVALRGVRARAQVPARREAVVAAYLHKLPGFVEWSAQSFATPASPIVVGVAGAPLVLEELVRIAKGRLVLGRPVVAQAIDTVAEVPPDLHVLFIGSEAQRIAVPLVDAARARHALIVTDLPTGQEMGAAIEFVQIDGRLRFEIFLAGARRCALKLSSPLMGVAWKVTEDTP